MVLNRISGTARVLTHKIGSCCPFFYKAVILTLGQLACGYLLGISAGLGERVVG